MKIKAIYENNVLKPLGDLNLPNKSRVNITIQESFSDLLDELGEAEEALKARSANAKQKIQQVAAKIAVAIDQIGGTGASSKKVICSNCGTEIPEGVDKCPKCGEAKNLLETKAGKTSGKF